MRFLVPLSLVFLIVACNGSPTEPQHFEPGTLTGRIVFAETGAPAAGARVVASQSPPGNSRGETLADADGNYRLTNLVGGMYAVHVYAPGAGPNERAYLRVLLLGSATVLNVQISNNRCVTINGTVTDRITRLPISGAAVRFGDQSTTSGTDGMFSLSMGCPPPDAGVSRLWSVRHPDYQPREFQNPVPSHSTTYEVVLDRL
jgi:hypothetical protein